jgi:hypothetical protein
MFVKVINPYCEFFAFFQPDVFHDVKIQAKRQKVKHTKEKIEKIKEKSKRVAGCLKSSCHFLESFLFAIFYFLFC